MFWAHFKVSQLIIDVKNFFFGNYFFNDVQPEKCTKSENFFLDFQDFETSFWPFLVLFPPLFGGLAWNTLKLCFYLKKLNDVLRKKYDSTNKKIFFLFAQLFKNVTYSEPENWHKKSMKFSFQKKHPYIKTIALRFLKAKWCNLAGLCCYRDEDFFCFKFAFFSNF